MEEGSVIFEIDQDNGSNILILETTNEDRLKVSCYDGDWGNIWLTKAEVIELVNKLDLWLTKQEQSDL